MASSRIDPDGVRKRLRMLRIERGLTQDALAERANLSEKHYQDLELGRKGFNPNLETLNSLATALDVEIFDLLYDRKTLLDILRKLAPAV